MPPKSWISKNQVTITAWVLVGITFFLILYKVLFLGYTFKNIIPQIKYTVNLSISMEGFGEDVSITTYIPASDQRQSISEEENNSGLFNYTISDTDGTGKIIQWKSDALEGKHQINYNFVANLQHQHYELATNLQIPETVPDDLKKYLVSTPNIPLEDPDVLKVFNKVVPRNADVRTTLQAIFDYVYALKPMPFKGLTDAVTAIKLGEASCNGKSRVFVALARLAGLPSRLVGGLILENGSKKTSHQWVEVYINGFWVPFDGLNNHFGDIPENYLTLYYTDQFLFKHTKNINFHYLYTISKKLTTRDEFVNEIQDTPFNTYAVWDAFQRIGIPLSLLRIIIMIPLGVSMIVIFRNVIGFETFGTFLPALIATASRGTGFLWGMAAFLVIIMLTSVLHLLLDKWGLLHTPKMSIMLIAVIAGMFSLTVLGVRTGLFQLSQVSLFPIAILAITAERFSIITIEEGWKKAFKITFMTAIVIGFAYMAMNSLAMQALFLAFPELLLLLIAFNLWLGKWIGIRVTELKRFRWLVSDDK